MSIAAPARPRVPRHPDHAGDGASRAVAGRVSAHDRVDGLRVAPDRGGEHRTRRHLRPVERPGRRRSPLVPVLVGVGMVVVALFALAAMHALLISGQVRLDSMRRDVASEHEQIRRLELQVAELESPGRVLDVARERLGMVQPTEVGYLLPAGVDTGDGTPVRVDAAEPPSEPDPEDTAGDPENGSEDTSGSAAVDGTVDDPAGTDATHAVEDRPGEGGLDE